MTEQSHIEAIENELKQIETSKAWNQVYQKVRSDGSYEFPLTAARSAINRPLNRYRDVLPYDHSRIILRHPTTDYINASLVKVESIQRQYILTQGPLSHTSQHFWLMVWQQQCRGVVMLNKIIEKNMIKCHQYWPLGEKNGGQDSMDFPAVSLRVDLVTEAKHHHYVLRTLRLTDTDSCDSREVLHYHYTTWPDFGVPQSPDAFNKFLAVVMKSGCLAPTVGPPIVHCSAGIGRSGTFCLVDTLLVMLERGLCSSNLGTVLEVLLDMRRYRMGLIQTPDQLRFSYQAIVHAARQRLQQRRKEAEAEAAVTAEANDRRGTAETNGCLDNGGDDGTTTTTTTTTTTGAVDPCVSSSSSSEDDDAAACEGPPRPPMRTDSITRSMMEAQLRRQLLGEGENSEEEEDEDEEEEEEEEDEDGPLDLGNNVLHEDLTLRALPAVPPSPTSPNPPPRPAPPSTASTTTTTASNTATSPISPEQLATQMSSEIRRRRQKDRAASLSSKVSSIKAKQAAADAWQHRKRPVAGAVAGGGGGDAGDGEGPAKKPRL